MRAKSRTGFDLERDLGTAGGDDPAVDQDVHDVGHEVLEQALIVRDREDAEVRAAVRTSAMPAATWRSASMSSPESVSSSTATSGSIIAICSTSLRFFSPPEKPSLR